MQNEKTDRRNGQHNVSMSERDKQKTVSNPSPGSADPGAADNVHDDNRKGGDARRKS